MSLPFGLLQDEYRTIYLPRGGSWLWMYLGVSVVGSVMQ
jgi:hypothetical protein